MACAGENRHAGINNPANRDVADHLRATVGARAVCRVGAKSLRQHRAVPTLRSNLTVIRLVDQQQRFRSIHRARAEQTAGDCGNVIVHGHVNRWNHRASRKRSAAGANQHDVAGLFRKAFRAKLRGKRHVLYRAREGGARTAAAGAYLRAGQPYE